MALPPARSVSYGARFTEQVRRNIRSPVLYLSATWCAIMGVLSIRLLYLENGSSPSFWWKGSAFVLVAVGGLVLGNVLYAGFGMLRDRPIVRVLRAVCLLFPLGLQLRVLMNDIPASAFFVIVLAASIVWGTPMAVYTWYLDRDS